MFGAIIRSLIRLSMVGLARGPHVTRYYMYEHLSRVLSYQRREVSGRILSISHSLPLCEALGLSNGQIVEANYPDYNMLSLPFPDASFDYVVSDQVLEHVEGNPQVAIDESFRVLKPQGVAVHTTCLINPIHNSPGDYWRFTPAGLRLLCGDSAQVLDVGGWGNPYVWLYVRLGLRFDGVPRAQWHPVHLLATRGSEKWAITTWVVAKKFPLNV